MLSVGESSLPDLKVRAAIESDLEPMTRVYAHHVRNGTGSFEEDPPGQHEMMERWLEREKGGHPTLVAYYGDRFAGFAYAGPHKPRSAYRFTVEDSIYVEPEFTGRGIGAVLLNGLIEKCVGLGFKQMIAVIGDSDNLGSIALHSRCGFRHVGTAEAVGYKHGKWLDVVFMQRALNIENS